MSYSSDGTVRLWDLNGKTTFKELRTETVIWVKNKKKLRTRITAGRFNKKGKSVFVVEEVRLLRWMLLCHCALCVVLEWKASCRGGGTH